MFDNLNKGRKLSPKISRLRIVKILLKAREDVLNTFKSNLISVTSDTKLMQHLEQHQYMKIFFINEIKNDEKKRKQ